MMYGGGGIRIKEFHNRRIFNNKSINFNI